MSKQQDIENIKRQIRESESTLSILQRDQRDTTRIDNLIAQKKQHLQRLQAEIEDLLKSRERLPIAIEATQRNIAVLKQKLKTLETSGDVEKLRRLLETAAKAGIDVASLLPQKQ